MCFHGMPLSKLERALRNSPNENGEILMLLANGEDPNQLCFGKTLLQIKCEEFSPNNHFIEALIASGADVNKTGTSKLETPLALACQNYPINIDLISLLLQKGAVSGLF